MNALVLAGWLTGLSSLSFGILVYFRTANRRLGRVWAIFTLTVSMYGFFLAWASGAATAERSLLTWRLGYAFGVVWIAPTFFHIVLVLLRRENPRLLAVHYVIGAIVCVTLVPTRYLFSHAAWMFGTCYYAQVGRLFPLFLVWWLGLIVYSHGLLLAFASSCPPEEQHRVKYFALGTLIGFIGGSFCFPAHFGFPYLPWGLFGISLYPVIMAIGVVRHRTLDVTLIIRKTLVYSGVTAFFTAAFLTLLYGVTRAFEGAARPNLVTSLLAAYTVALLLHPVRARLQRWVDERFPRESLDPKVLREATSDFIHEIKGPLASISLPAQLALAEVADVIDGSRPAGEVLPKTVERLKGIIEESQSAGRRIEAIRDVAAGRTGDRESVPLETLLRGVLARYEARMSRAAITQVLRVDAPRLLIAGQPDQLDLVFSNVIKNAIEALEAIPEDRERSLTVRLASTATEVVVEVSDSGVGISSEQLAKVFDPYFSTKGSQGMGVGLYLTRSILALHNASIDVRSDAGKGATFTIRFPIR